MSSSPYETGLRTEYYGVLIVRADSGAGGGGCEVAGIAAVWGGVCGGSWTLLDSEGYEEITRRAKAMMLTAVPKALCAQVLGA